MNYSRAVLVNTANLLAALQLVLKSFEVSLLNCNRGFLWRGLAGAWHLGPNRRALTFVSSR